MRIKDITFFYINCKKDSFKNKLMLSQWNDCCSFYGQDIPLIRRDAVHYNDFSYPYYLECFQSSVSKIDGQISNYAVYKSHTNLWKFIWDKKIKYAIIFEDDVIIHRTFLKDLENIFNNPPNIDFLFNKNQWDIIYFGILRMMAQKTHLNDFHKVLNKKGYNNGLHCYLIHHQSAGKLIQLTSKLGAINQIDILLRDNADKLNYYVYRTLLVKQNVENLESTRLGRFVKDEFKKTFDEINIIS